MVLMIEKEAVWVDTPEADEWLAQQQRPHPVVIESKPPTYFENWRNASFLTKLAGVILVGFIIPWIIMIVGFIGLALWTGISHRIWG